MIGLHAWMKRACTRTHTYTKLFMRILTKTLTKSRVSHTHTHTHTRKSAYAHMSMCTFTYFCSTSESNVIDFLVVCNQLCLGLPGFYIPYSAPAWKVKLKICLPWDNQAVHPHGMPCFGIFFPNELLWHARAWIYAVFYVGPRTHETHKDSLHTVNTFMSTDAADVLTSILLLFWGHAQTSCTILFRLSRRCTRVFKYEGARMTVHVRMNTMHLSGFIFWGAVH